MSLCTPGLTQDLWLVLHLFNADIEDSKGFVVSVLSAVDGGQSGRLGGYEDSSLAPIDRHRLAQRIFVFRRWGQTLSVDHLGTNQIKQVINTCINDFQLRCLFPSCIICTAILWQKDLEQDRAWNAYSYAVKDNDKHLWTWIVIVLGPSHDPFLVRWNSEKVDFKRVTNHYTGLFSQTNISKRTHWTLTSSNLKDNRITQKG